jgi:hypothetical protein
MKSAVQFVAFQILWFVAVSGAARGHAWLGFVAFVPYIVLHVTLVPPAERQRELTFVLLAGALGTVLDSALKALAITNYPSSVVAWPSVIVPPFITILWMAFATLPRFSMHWLRARPVLAALLGALGGPASYAAGVRLGATAVGPEPALTWGVLALEYAIVMPLLLRLAPGAVRTLAVSNAKLGELQGQSRVTPKRH